MGIKLRIFLLLTIFTNLYCASGALDPSFGVGGIALTKIGSNSQIKGIATQSSGKIIVAGSANITNSIISGALARYNTDNTLDTTFGLNGTTDSTLGSFNALAIQTDDKIVVAVPDHVSRYTADGALDTTFNGTGSLNINNTSLNAVTIQPDGKIVVAGLIFSSNAFFVARINTDGTLDTSFNGTGTNSTVIGTSSSTANAVIIQTDGNIVLGGSATLSGVQQFALARYVGTTGLLDTSFNPPGNPNQPGVVTTPINTSSSINSLVQDSSSTFVAAGNTGITTSDQNGIALARYDISDGSLDSSFNGTGIATTFGILHIDYFANAIVLQSDSKLVIAGYSLKDTLPTLDQFLLARYDTTGALDMTFGTAGIVTAPLGNGQDSQANALTLLANGTIVPAGFAINKNVQQFAFADFSTAGTLLTQTLTPVGGFAEINAIALQSDQKIVIAGTSVSPQGLFNNEVLAVARYLPDGSLDTSFNSASIGTPQAGLVYLSDFVEATGVAIQSDGKIVVTCEGENSNAMTVARFDTNGILDTTFGSSGIASAPQFSSGSFDGAVDLAIQSDGSIVMAGYTFDSSDKSKIGVARFTSTGTIDTSFNPHGPVPGTISTAIGTSDDEANAVVIQSDGKIVVGGFTTTSTTPSSKNFALVRYLTTGTPDSSFGTSGNGIVTTPISHLASEINSLALQADQKIVAAGYASNTAKTTSEFVLTRYNTNGTLDDSFGNAGIVTTTFTRPLNVATGVGINSSQQIIASGYTANPNSNSSLSAIGLFAVASYNPDGSLDSTFGTGGKVTTSILTSAIANALVLENDPSIIVAGYAIDANYASQFALAKYINSIVPPVVNFVKITSPKNNSTVTTTSSTIKGIALAGDTVTVFIDGINVGSTTATNGTWSIIPDISLANGKHIVEAKAFDPLSTTTVTDSITIIVNVTPVPPVKCILPTDLLTVVIRNKYTK